MKTDIKALTVSILLGIVFCSINYVLHRSGKKEMIDTQESFFDRLGDEEVVQLEITTNLSNLIENRSENIIQQASLSVHTAEGETDYPIEVSLRGKTRRDLCSFPPLKLRFDEKLLKAEDMQTFDKYKLVTHCKENSDLVLKEYMAYQLYNQLTEYSFRARLVEVTYIDQGQQMDTTTQYAILLENYGEMAQRLAAQKMPKQLPDNTRIPSEDYQRLVVFQYMIGNTDWNLYKQHNIKWLQTKGSAIPVPYDFDFSGLVDAPYAQPHPSLPIANVRQRYLQYRGQDQQELEAIHQEIDGQKEDLLRLCTQLEAIDLHSKQDVVDYLNEFFERSAQAYSNSDVVQNGQGV